MRSHYGMGRAQHVVARACRGMDRNPNETARKIVQEALNRLSAELEKGNSETLQNYLAAMSRFRRYSWSNVLLISAQRPDATSVAGIHGWNDLGRSVTQGEKGILILVPVGVRPSSHNRAPPGDDPVRTTGFRAAYVFDVSQTEGKPLPELARRTIDPKDYAEQLKALIAKRGVDLAYDRSIAPAQGICTGGKIRLMPELPRPKRSRCWRARADARGASSSSGGPGAPHTTDGETQAQAVADVVSCGLGLEIRRPAVDYTTPLRGRSEGARAVVGRRPGDLRSNP